MTRPLQGSYPDPEEDYLEDSSDECEHVSDSGKSLTPVPSHMPMTVTTTSVPFRTSLSPDFLRLFAPSSAAAPPTPPKMTYLNQPQEDCMSLGLDDIRPSDDLFGPFADKDDLFNKTFEDLCISDDDSDRESI